MVAYTDRTSTVVRTGVGGGLSLSPMSMLISFICTSACSTKASCYSGIPAEVMMLVSRRSGIATEMVRLFLLPR